MQLSELVQAVRDEVQDQAAQRWSNATIIRYLNDAQLDLAQVSKQLTSWTSAVQAGAVYVPRPPDLLIPKAFWFEIGTWRYPLKMQYGLPPENQAVQGDPESVHLVGDYMYFYPVVQQPGTLYISGTMRPTPMALDTDAPSIQDADSLLITYAAWMCFLSDGDPIASTKESWYRQRKLDWAILDAQKHPMPDRIERNWWW